MLIYYIRYIIFDKLNSTSILRPLRINYPDATYHVMNRGLARNKIVTGKSDYREFLTTLFEIHDLWHVQVYAYCIINNHYHVCLKTPEGNLPSVMELEK